MNTLYIPSLRVQPTPALISQASNNALAPAFAGDRALKDRERRNNAMITAVLGLAFLRGIGIDALRPVEWVRDSILARPTATAPREPQFTSTPSRLPNQYTSLGGTTTTSQPLQDTQRAVRTAPPVTPLADPARGNQPTQLNEYKSPGFRVHFPSYTRPAGTPLQVDPIRSSKVPNDNRFTTAPGKKTPLKLT